MTADATQAGGSGLGDQVSKGADRIRDTAKWLVAGFGALGSVLIASLQLSNLGQVSGDSRTWALAGFALSIAGVLVAMLAAASVLIAVRVSLTEVETEPYLKDYFGKNEELLGGYSTVKQLHAKYREQAQARITSYSGMLARTYGPQAGSLDTGQKSDAFKAERNQYNLAEQELALINPAVNLVLGAAVFEKLRHRWMWGALPGITVGVVLAAVGACVYAVNAQAPAAAASTSNEALIRLTAAGQQHLGGKLGAQCTATDIEVLVLRHDAAGWQFQTVSDTCNSVVFNAANDDVLVEAQVQPCPLPSSTPSGTPSPSVSPSAAPSAPVSVC